MLHRHRCSLCGEKIPRSERRRLMRGLRIMTLMNSPGGFMGRRLLRRVIDPNTDHEICGACELLHQQLLLQQAQQNVQQGTVLNGPQPLFQQPINNGGNGSVYPQQPYSTAPNPIQSYSTPTQQSLQIQEISSNSQQNSHQYGPPPPYSAT